MRTTVLAESCDFPTFLLTIFDSATDCRNVSCRFCTFLSLLIPGFIFNIIKIYKAILSVVVYGCETCFLHLSMFQAGIFLAYKIEAWDGTADWRVIWWAPLNTCYTTIVARYFYIRSPKHIHCIPCLLWYSGDLMCSGLLLCYIDGHFTPLQKYSEPRNDEKNNTKF